MIILPYVQTSVFVDRRHSFGGNQLATFYDIKLNSFLDDSEMQGIAREMNFSETTFLMKSNKVRSGIGIRIFTPFKELPFAGHPTLGSAFVLRNKKLISSEDSTTTIELLAGSTEIDFNQDTISMTQPYPDFLVKYDKPSILADALGLEVSDLSNQYPIQVLSSGAPYIIVPLTNIEAVQRTVPRTSQILDILSDLQSNGVVVFCTETSHSNSHLHARMFAPGLGVAEDPATGSAAGPLGAYVEHYKVLDNHKQGTTILIEQGHEIGRPSLLRSSVVRSKNDYVRVGGLVRITAEGNFLLQHDENIEPISQH